VLMYFYCMRYRELEATIVDLQESIRRRYPDSVSSLIRAATVSDDKVVKQQKQLEATIESLRGELNAAKESYELKLLSLRQEHEKIKRQYEAKMEAVNTKGSDAEGRSKVEVPKGPSKGNSSQPIKTLSQAQNRIR
jgi:hypothetical protein